MDVTQRIAQFETMVRPGADPDNDMAWFSLGRAYAEAGRHDDAARAFARCLEINPAMSKAYQLAGEAYIARGELSKASDILKRGYTTAFQRGDRMPMTAMGELLKKIGDEPPAVAAAAAETGPAGTFVCKRTGRAGRQLPRPPFKGPVGAWIHANISQETWDNWVRQGTKVINELRLDLSREEDSETYDRHMREFLGIDDELYQSLAAGKPR
ncbi:putative Fe(2+)-trafficking protein [Phycisphaerales bacterium]|nr:putative Fe(2+)-trafficking protein [Phycisphaerales bacterium]